MRYVDGRREKRFGIFWLSITANIIFAIIGFILVRIASKSKPDKIAAIVTDVVTKANA